jgi:hypothetical protein
MSSAAKAPETAPSLVDSLEEYLRGLPREDRADALHQVFYGFYTRIAVIDRTTYELAAWAKGEAAAVAGTTGTLAEALRDNALFVGQDLFAARMRAMSAMGYISKRLVSLLNGAPPPSFTLTHAIAFDQDGGELRRYELAKPGQHPDLPYDPLSYELGAEGNDV